MIHNEMTFEPQMPHEDAARLGGSNRRSALTDRRCEEAAPERVMLPAPSPLHAAMLCLLADRVGIDRRGRELGVAEPLLQSSAAPRRWPEAYSLWRRRTPRSHSGGDPAALESHIRLRKA